MRDFIAKGTMRLQKYLARCGVASRRHSEALIEEGRVTVNGAPASVGMAVDPAVDTVLVEGRPVSPDEHAYVLLNKPRGVVTSARDTHRRRTVMDCLAGLNVRVFPVGRLDMDVAGALLLTNDGELAHRLMHPSYLVKKVYLVSVRGSITAEAVARLRAGVKLDDGMTAPAEVKVLAQDNQESVIRLVLHEGRKREVKRMCSAIGHEVRKLRRIAVADIRVNGLKPGRWRFLEPREIEGLRRLTGLG